MHSACLMVPSSRRPSHRCRESLCTWVRRFACLQLFCELVKNRLLCRFFLSIGILCFEALLKICDLSVSALPWAKSLLLELRQSCLFPSSFETGLNFSRQAFSAAARASSERSDASFDVHWASAFLVWSAAETGLNPFLNAARAAARLSSPSVLVNASRAVFNCASSERG